MPYRHPDDTTNAQITAENDKLLRLSHVGFAAEILAGMVLDRTSMMTIEEKSNVAFEAARRLMINAGLHKDE